MTSPACKKEQCEECETYACKHPCHFLPPDEEITDEEGIVEDEEDEAEEPESLHMSDREGEEDLFL